MKRWILSGALVVACAALTVSAAATAQPQRGVTATATTVNVKASEFKFVLSRRTAPHGSITFVVKNVGKLAHDFKITTKKTKLLKPGQSTRLIVRLAKGRYPYKCTVPGHAAAGMKGVFRVT